MSAKAKNIPPADEPVIRLYLSPGHNYSDLAGLLNDLDQRKRYLVCIDLCAVSSLGTVEFRVLKSFAEAFKQHGGFLKLENANANVLALVLDFGCTHLLAAQSQPPTM